MNSAQANCLPVSQCSRFDQVYEAHHVVLKRIACMLCGDIHLANDLLQETWIRAWRALDSLHDIHAVRSWLVTILKREHARLYRRERCDTVLLDEDVHAPCGSAAQEQSIWVQQILADLDDDERQPLLAQVVDGRSVTDIAAEHGISRNAMTIRLHRLRKRLQRDAAAELG